MSDIQTKTGTVEKVYHNERFPKVNLVIDGAKFSDYDGKNIGQDVTEGATVSFPYKQNGQYSNIAGKVTVTSPGSAPAPPVAPGQVDKRQIMIMRQNALGHAIQFCNKTYPDGYEYSQAMVIAAEFVEWYQS